MLFIINIIYFFYENYFIEYNNYKDESESLKKSETSLIYEINKLYIYYINNNNIKIISIFDFKNYVFILNKKIFELQK